jgi:hypothetical protein
VRRWPRQRILGSVANRHPLVVVLLSAALSSLAVVVEIKFLVVAVLGVATSFTVGWLMTRIRPLARVI